MTGHCPPVERSWPKFVRIAGGSVSQLVGRSSLRLGHSVKKLSWSNAIWAAGGSANAIVPIVYGFPSEPLTAHYRRGNFATLC